VSNKPNISNQELVVLAESWELRARQLQVVDQATYDATAELLRVIKALQDEAEAHHRPTIILAHKTHLSALADLKRALTPLLAAEAMINAKTLAFIDRVKAQDLERQRLQDLEDARKHREALEDQIRDREALEASQAELRRIQDLERDRERIAQEEALEAKLAVLEAAGTGPEEIARVLEVAATQAQAMETDTETVPPLPPPPPAPPMVRTLLEPILQLNSGASPRVKYAARVVDVRELLQAALDIPEAYLKFVQPNETVLNAEARMAKEQFNVPGCELDRTTGLSTRR